MPGGKPTKSNVRATYLLARFFVPLLLNGGLKTLVNMASVDAHITMPGISSYQSGKLAATRITEFVALENQEQGLITFSNHPKNNAETIVDLEILPKPSRAVFFEPPELPADGLAFLTKKRREWLSGR